MKSIVGLIASFYAVGLSQANATVITYELTSLGGSDYSVEFSVENNSLGIQIEEFTIFFPAGEYESILVLSSPIDWDGVAIQPDAGIPDDGFTDWLALGTPIASGATLSGFVAVFTFLGAGTPGDFIFDIIDPLTFASLETGVALLSNASPSEIPLPASIWLFCLGILGLFRRNFISSKQSVLRSKKALLTRQCWKA